MKRLLGILAVITGLGVAILVAVLLVTGEGGSGGDEEATGQADTDTGSAPTPGSERPLEDAWYQDPDGDFMPTAVEQRIGSDPEANECFEALNCPGVSARTGLPEEPKESNTLLMLDSSGSMRGSAGRGQTKLTAAKDALGRFVAGTSDQANLGFLVFGHKGSNRQADKRVSCRAPELLEPVGEVDFRSFPGTLRRFEPTGFTPIARSLALAERAFEGAEGADNRVILVTDGIETCGGNPVARARALKQAGIEVTVDVVGFDIAKAGDREKLQRIAKATGGTYTDAQTGSALQDYFENQTARVGQLISAAACLRGKDATVGACSKSAVIDAVAEMNELADEASQAGDDERAEELDRLSDEMDEADSRFRAERTERIDGIRRRLSREQEKIQRRLRNRYGAVPGASFAGVPGLCPASPFVRTRVLLPREALLLAQRS